MIDSPLQVSHFPDYQVGKTSGTNRPLLLSIIIPTHNRSEALNCCLSSIASMTAVAQQTEVIVVDDASSQKFALNNKSICKQHGARYHYLDRNSGAAIARNAGIKLATGEWCAFLDDDVLVDPGWHGVLMSIIAAADPDLLGVEGAIVPMGDGVWDKEVANSTGGLFLTANIAFRRNILERINGFDEYFVSPFFYCEDHDLAARVLMHGSICFEPELRVFHQPRKIDWISFLTKAPLRIYYQLRCESYFFNKQKDRYHQFRHCPTFSATLRAILFKYTISTLRRRSLKTLFSRPIQTLTLVTASLIEQLSAWIICWSIIVQHKRLRFFIPRINWQRTLKLWQLADGESPELFRLDRSLFAVLFFPVFHRSAYKVTRTLCKVSKKSDAPQLRILLRIDDMFLSEQSAIKSICTIFKDRKIPFCAGVVGCDFIRNNATETLQLIKEAGGAIALHGFVHKGKFGPYPSELLQMNIPAISRGIAGIENMPAYKAFRPEIFIAPFNAVSRDQILFLGDLFRIVCGGPETLRFTDRLFGPLAIGDKSWYIPSFPPWYGSARNIRTFCLPRKLDAYKGILSLTLHLDVEAQDEFRSCKLLADDLFSRCVSWEHFINSNRGLS